MTKTFPLIRTLNVPLTDHGFSREKVTSPGSGHDLLKDFIQHNKDAQLILVFLSIKSQSLLFVTFPEPSGFLDAGVVNEVIRLAVAHSAAAMLIARYTNLFEQMPIDSMVHERLQSYVSHFDIQILDQLLFNSHEYYSFAQQGDFTTREIAAFNEPKVVQI